MIDFIVFITMLASISWIFSNYKEILFGTILFLSALKIAVVALMLYFIINDFRTIDHAKCK